MDCILAKLIWDATQSDLIQLWATQIRHVTVCAGGCDEYPQILIAFTLLPPCGKNNLLRSIYKIDQIITFSLSINYLWFIPDGINMLSRCSQLTETTEWILEWTKMTPFKMKKEKKWSQNAEKMCVCPYCFHGKKENKYQPGAEGSFSYVLTWCLGGKTLAMIRQPVVAAIQSQKVIQPIWSPSFYSERGYSNTKNRMGCACKLTPVSDHAVVREITTTSTKQLHYLLCISQLSCLILKFMTLQVKRLN